MSDARPRIPSHEWLLQAGRDLMNYWNRQGAVLPQQGQDYQRWWVRTHRQLENSWGVVPEGDLAETMDRYAEIARRYHRQHGTGRPPPAWSTPEGLASSFAGGAGVAVGLAVVLVVALLLRK